MATALGTAHFRPPPRMALTGLPGIAKLSARLGEACGKGLATLGPAPWRVAAEALTETLQDPPADVEALLLRFESEAGSLTARLMIDRPAISALLEAAMGGTGTEAAFALNERPLSRIEAGILDHTRSALANALATGLGDHFARHVSLFGNGETPDLSPGPQGFAEFRYTLNVFSCSGELRLVFARDELERQIRASGAGDADDAAAARKAQLQQEVGKSPIELTVTLGSELLPVETIAVLRPGMLVSLSGLVTSPVLIWSGGVAAYRGTLARNGDRLAVMVTGPAG